MGTLILQNREISQARPQGPLPAGYLTPAEIRVLRTFAQGYSYIEVSQLLGISVKTVSIHRESLARKLNAHNLSSLTRKAIEYGILPIEIQYLEIMRLPGEWEDGLVLPKPKAEIPRK